MAEIRLLRPVAADDRTERAKDDARRLRDLAAQVETGECSAFVCIAVVNNDLDVVCNASPWETVTLARLLDAWAVRKVLP